MRNIILLACIGALYMVSGCKEIGPPILYGGGSKSIDTSYIAPVESAQQRNVLVEEFSGVTCPNCPQGHDVLKSISTAHGSNVVITGYYIFGTPQTEPVTGLTTQDFRDSGATTIGNQFYSGVAFLPGAGIDRVDFGSGLLLGRSIWGDKVNARLAVPTIVNLYLTSTYDTSRKEATIILRSAFTQPVGHVRLNVGIAENNIIQPQEDQLLVDTFYNENNVFRAMVTTPVTGNPYFDTLATKAAGRVCQSIFTYKVTNPKWVINNCKVFAFLTDSTQQVLQAVETTLNGH